MNVVDYEALKSNLVLGE